MKITTGLRPGGFSAFLTKNGYSKIKIENRPLVMYNIFTLIYAIPMVAEMTPIQGGTYESNMEGMPQRACAGAGNDAGIWPLRQWNYGSCG
jgi:hypothetical protein